MKLFRTMIVSFHVSMGFHMLVMFVAGDHTIMMFSHGPEMFPILRSRKCMVTSIHSKQDRKRAELFIQHT